MTSRPAKLTSFVNLPHHLRHRGVWHRGLLKPLRGDEEDFVDTMLTNAFGLGIDRDRRRNLFDDISDRVLLDTGKMTMSVKQEKPRKPIDISRWKKPELGFATEWMLCRKCLQVKVPRHPRGRQLCAGRQKELEVRRS